MKRTLLLLPFVALVLPLAGCGDDEATTGSGDSTPGRTMSTPAQGTCTFDTDGAAAAAKKVEVPPSNPPAADKLTITTNRGDLVVTLDAKRAPCAAGNFTWLADHGYFDGTDCHRLVADFVLQCGDPTGTGTGGPGWSFADELKGDETYPAGTVAMANSGPDTNGSQFFVVIQDADLPASYTVFGHVDDPGLELVRKISADGNGPDGVAPKESVTIESVK
ncbi:MAG: peptidylprolyl isomerase [Nocardioidaceae bacterium]